MQGAMQGNMNSTFLQGKSIKSGWDRIGGSDHNRVYVKWPQEACFIGPGRIRVIYDELTQSQWTAGITAIATEEKIPAVQRNMFTYRASDLSGHKYSHSEQNCKKKSEAAGFSGHMHSNAPV